MKSIPVSIKEKYVCYIGHKIMTEAAYKYQSVTNQVVAAMAGTAYDENRLITVNIEPDLIIALMDELGILAEKYTGSLHLAIKNELNANVAATAAAEMAKPQADMELMQSIQYLSEQIAARDASIDVWRNERIVDGRNFFVA